MKIRIKLWKSKKQSVNNRRSSLIFTTDRRKLGKNYDRNVLSVG